MTLPKTDIASRVAPKGDDISALCAPLTSLKGLGPRGEELLTKVLAKPLSPPRVIDLLWHLPNGYLDRRLTPSIMEAAPGAVTTLVVKPVRYNAPPKGSARAPLRVVCEDESASLDLVFFHGDRNAMRRLLPLNELRIVSGRVERYGSRLQMTHPDYILAPSERAKLPAIEPVYPLTLGLTQKFLYRVMGDALAKAAGPSGVAGGFAFGIGKLAVLLARAAHPASSTVGGGPCAVAEGAGAARLR